MHMIKKIAFTASMLLFVLAQLFSFYVITASHKEKIELIREKDPNLLPLFGTNKKDIVI